MPTIREKLIFLCPAGLAANYPQIPDLFNVAGHLELRSGTYSQTMNPGDDDNGGFYEYFSGVGISLTPKRLGFQLQVTDQRFDLYRVFAKLAELSTSTVLGADRFTAVTVFDYRGVLTDEDVARGYALRYGRLLVPALDGGSFRAGYMTCVPGSPVVEVPTPNRRYVKPFTIRFIDQEKTRVW